MTLEEWKPIEGHSGYEISSLGRVRCWRPRTIRSEPPKTPRIVESHLNPGGYLKVRLGLYGGTHMIHRLVAISFLGAPPDGCEVAHGNGDRTDNRLANLRWATRRDNHKDKRKHGTNGRTVTQGVADEVRRLYRIGNVTQLALAEQFGITQATVSKLVLNQRWKESDQ